MSLPRAIGRYEVVGELAIGGMAEILLGRLRGPSGFERAVVIKRILRNLARQESFVAIRRSWSGRPEIDTDTGAALADLRQAVVNRSRLVLRHRSAPRGEHQARVRTVAQVLTAVSAMVSPKATVRPPDAGDPPFLET